MGIFPSTPPNTNTTTVHMISSFDCEPKGKQVVEFTSLSSHEAIYDTIQTLSDDHTDDLHLAALDPYHLPYWLEPSLPILDYLSKTFPFNESIWEDHHHTSLLLPNTSSVNHDFASLFSTDIVNAPQSPILLQDTDFEGNLFNITQTNPIDISANPGTIEHVHVG